MKRVTSAATIAALLLSTSCGGGGSSIPAPPPPIGSPGPTPGPTPTPPATPQRFYEDPAQVGLTQAQVQQVIAQGVAEAQARGVKATIAVVDRVGNVLAVFTMSGANPNIVVPRGPNGSTHDLQGVGDRPGLSPVPGAVAAAIAKAVTGAYLSSSGNAFSTRTASMIVQEHFPPSAVSKGLESGPLFGVQFSQLPCSDLSARFTSAGGAGALIGPKRSPLGLAADPGGFPLYVNGVVVGGVGVISDGVYGFDTEVRDVDVDNDEAIAFAASQGLAAPEGIRADHISLDGTLLRFTDTMPADLKSNPATAPGFASINGSQGTLTSVNGYYNAGAGVLTGTPYGSEASGIRRSTSSEFALADAYVLTNGAGTNRYPVRGGTEGIAGALSATEVQALLEEAFKVMTAARAQIRQPLDSRAQVSLSVVDTTGAVLGLVRSPDAPIFGIDVSLQKARSAMFFSSAFAGQQLLGNPDPDVSMYVGATRNFLGNQNALTGQTAFANRAIGNIARPYFPDGELGRPPGSLSRPIQEFNPFSTGLQSALIEKNVIEHVVFILGGGPDTPNRCTQNPNPNLLANGLQIFPGSVPVYRGSTLVGAIGISGDGIDQDDMISFLGTHNASIRVGGINNAPPSIRSDEVVVPSVGVRLRYVSCPFAPFLGSSDQNVCQGK
jgi:uncharacterized protein GlcG (DUF336 family)